MSGSPRKRRDTSAVSGIEFGATVVWEGMDVTELLEAKASCLK